MNDLTVYEMIICSASLIVAAFLIFGVKNND